MSPTPAPSAQPAPHRLEVTPCPGQAWRHPVEVLKDDKSSSSTGHAVWRRRVFSLADTLRIPLSRSMKLPSRGAFSVHHVAKRPSHPPVVTMPASVTQSGVSAVPSPPGGSAYHWRVELPSLHCRESPWPPCAPLCWVLVLGGAASQWIGPRPGGQPES